MRALGGAAGDPAADAVLRDLVDAAVAEGLIPVTAPTDAAGWGRVGPLRARLRPGGALQPWRLAGGPLLDTAGHAVAPADAPAALGLEGPGAPALAADMATAHAHARVLADRRAVADGGVTPRPGTLLPGERLAATRGRPFHPTGRAVSGWSAAELADLGPLRVAPLPVAWVAVRRDRLRHGPDPGSPTLAGALLDTAERARLDAGATRAGVDRETHQLLPVHAWQARRVLATEFAPEIAGGEVIVLDEVVGRFRPTASLRTLAADVDPRVHLKLPLGVATLGAARLLPPRYLDNGDRAEATMRAVVAADPVLGARVALCAEGCWAGWSRVGDEFDDRPGHLAAQVRTYPPAPTGTTPLPMAALAADEWGVLGPALGVEDPVAFFAGVAEAFTAVVVAFLARGVLPEVHGQNVVVHLAPGGRVVGFVLRDHDTLRVHRPWAAAAGVPDPGYRIRPGGRQTLVLDAAADLVGYAQTLGFQVNLYGVADALARHHGLDDRVLWACLRRAVERALDLVAPPPAVTAVITSAVLRAPEWPSRTVLGPLLATGPSSSVSMPAGTGRVPNPLRGIR